MLLQLPRYLYLNLIIIIYIYICLYSYDNLIILNYNDERYNLPFLGLPIMNMFMITLLYLTSQLLLIVLTLYVAIVTYL